MRLISSFGELFPYLVVVFATAAALSLAVTPLVRRFAVRLDNIDRPDHRRVNRNPIPRGGGMAVAFAFLVVVVGFLAVNDRLTLVVVPRSVEPAELAALLAGGALATLLGVLDDTFQLRASCWGSWQWP
jgi:UDP-GlcNAc:undecaprenyl-phosphate/decaprenyl-phosphate GlcNAc-1-phosphate transferase